MHSTRNNMPLACRSVDCDNTALIYARVELTTLSASRSREDVWSELLLLLLGYGKQQVRVFLRPSRHGLQPSEWFGERDAAPRCRPFLRRRSFAHGVCITLASPTHFQNTSTSPTTDGLASPQAGTHGEPRGIAAGSPRGRFVWWRRTRGRMTSCSLYKEHYNK